MKMKRFVLAMLCMFTLGGAASAQSPNPTAAPCLYTSNKPCKSPAPIWMKDRFIRATSSATVKLSLARTRPATLP